MGHEREQPSEEEYGVLYSAAVLVGWDGEERVYQLRSFGLLEAGRLRGDHED
jgi:hypothetical protein